MCATRPDPIDWQNAVSWAIVNRELEVRSRLACIVDALRVDDDADTALINAEWLLQDLDAADRGER